MLATHPGFGYPGGQTISRTPCALSLKSFKSF
jgi:hypothetical protein